MKVLNHTDHNLANYSMMNSKSEAVCSDHAPLVMEVKLEAIPTKKLKFQTLRIRNPSKNFIKIHQKQMFSHSALKAMRI